MSDSCIIYENGSVNDQAIINCCLANTSCSINSQYFPQCEINSSQNICTYNNIDYNNSVSPSCIQNLQTFCSGDDLPENLTKDQADQLISRWIQSGESLNLNSCLNFVTNLYFQQDLNDPDPCNYSYGLSINPSANVQQNTCRIPNNVVTTIEGFTRSVDILNSMVDKIIKYYDITASIDSDKYTPLSSLIYNNLCCRFPELCQEILPKICETKTTEDISLNPNVARLCGCFLSSSEYQHYFETYGISIECSPMCNNNYIIPLTDVDKNPIVCNETVCIIDNVSVNILNSQVNGSVNISQFCGNCGNGSSCTCIVDGDTLQISDSTVNGNINLNEVCGNTFVNTINQQNYGPKNVQVTLENYNYGNNGFNAPTNYILMFFLVLFIIFVLIFIIIISCTMYFKDSQREKDIKNIFSKK